MRRGTEGHVAEPRGSTRAPVWRGCDTCTYLYLLVLYRVIVHISIRNPIYANPLFFSHFINPFFPFYFYRMGLCSTFFFNFRHRGLTRSVGSKARGLSCVDAMDSKSTGSQIKHVL